MQHLKRHSIIKKIKYKVGTKSEKERFLWKQEKKKIILKCMEVYFS